MKVHSIVDCITNSSSTSFIIGLDKIPETEEELYGILFPNNEKTIKFYSRDIDTKDISNAIFEYIKELPIIENEDKLKNEIWFYDEEYIDEYIINFFDYFENLNIYLLTFPHDSDDFCLQNPKIYKNIKYIKMEH